MIWVHLVVLARPGLPRVIYLRVKLHTIEYVIVFNLYFVSNEYRRYFKHNSFNS